MKYLPLPKCEIYPTIEAKEGWYQYEDQKVVHWFYAGGKYWEETVEDFPYYKLPNINIK